MLGNKFLNFYIHFLPLLHRLHQPDDKLTTTTTEEIVRNNEDVSEERKVTREVML